MSILRRILSFLKKVFLDDGMKKNGVVEKDAPYDDIVDRKDSVPSYCPRNFMTLSEKEFYDKLVHLETLGEYKIIPQINLATIIEKKSEQRYQSELNRNIDFALFDYNFNLLLLIELNDSSHQKKDRIDRDLKVQKFCNDCNFKLMKFYTKYPNELSYIVNRILKEIQLMKKDSEELVSI